MSKSQQYIFSEHDSSYYIVLKKLFTMKRKGLMPISAIEVQQSVDKSYFPISLERVEEVLEELYNNFILGRWEYENGDIKYELTL